VVRPENSHTVPVCCEIYITIYRIEKVTVKPQFETTQNNLRRKVLICAGRLDKMFVDMKDKVIVELSAVEHVCTTADIWSSNHKSFLGVTGHWIDPSSLERRSVALACDRMVGRHTYDAIAAKLSAVHSSYRIGRKVLMTITDNGSNFVKAFNEYSCKLVDDDDDDDLSHEDVSNVLAAGECDDGTEYVLPPHQRCASHTLNLVAVHDTENALNDAGYKRVCRGTMAKCSGLWNKASRSTQCADVVSETPHITGSPKRHPLEFALSCDGEN